MLLKPVKQSSRSSYYMTSGHDIVHCLPDDTPPHTYADSVTEGNFEVYTEVIVAGGLNKDQKVDFAYVKVNVGYYCIRRSDNYSICADRTPHKVVSWYKGLLSSQEALDLGNKLAELSSEEKLEQLFATCLDQGFINTF